MNRRPARRPVWTTIAMLAVATVLTACGSTPETLTRTGDEDSTGLEFTDMWVKAADEGMSAAFGTIVNTTDSDVTIVSGTSAASTIIELHETVEDETGTMVMRQKDGGFVIPAGGEYVLEPGANHLMLMDLQTPILAGDEVKFSLHLADGSSVEFSAPAKDYTGADEQYAPGH